MHLKLKGSPLIALVGFMGCGKSTVGRLLAERVGWPFVDLDEEIERRTGRAIPEIFEQEGEAQFRELEHEAFIEQQRLARQGLARVVALGGGAFAQSRNRDELEISGLSIWLDCPLDELWRRVSKEAHRPLARRRGEFERLYHERLPHYRLADFTVAAASDAPVHIVEAILKLPLF